MGTFFFKTIAHVRNLSTNIWTIYLQQKRVITSFGIGLLLNWLIFFAQIILYMHIIHIWSGNAFRWEKARLFQLNAFRVQSRYVFFFRVVGIARAFVNEEMYGHISCVCVSSVRCSQTIQVTFISVYSITLWLGCWPRNAEHGNGSTQNYAITYEKSSDSIILCTGHDINSIRCCRCCFFSLLCKLLISGTGTNNNNNEMWKSPLRVERKRATIICRHRTMNE